MKLSNVTDLSVGYDEIAVKMTDWYSIGKPYDPVVFGDPDPVSGMFKLYLRGSNEVELLKDNFFLAENTLYGRPHGQKGDIDILQAHSSKDQSVPKIVKFCSSSAFFLLSASGEAFFAKKNTEKNQELLQYKPVFEVRCSGNNYWFQNKDGWYCLGDNIYG